MSAPLSFHDYDPGHPWYYLLGGKPLTLKQIREHVGRRGYRGYNRDEIATASGRCEPRRSQELRTLRSVALGRLKEDISGYRRAVFLLHEFRAAPDTDECAEVHVSVSLKHNHLFNEFAHLLWIDELLTHQLDLFEC